MDFAVKAYSRAELVEMGAVFDFNGSDRYLSNFARSDVVMYGITHPTVEHAFAAAKLDPKGGVHDRTVVMNEMRAIAAAASPGAAKGLGRRRTLNGKPFMRADWDQVKEVLILELLRRKFAIPALRAKLLATGDALLVEGNTHGDRIWGMVEDAAGIFHGRNMLGEMLMAVRAEIRAEATAA